MFPADLHGRPHAIDPSVRARPPASLPMRALAALAALSSGALAQPDPGARRPDALAALALGAGNDGAALSVSAGPNLGRMTPQVFGAFTTGPDRRGEQASRTTAGVVGRLAVDPPGGPFDIAATVGPAYSSARAPSPVLLEDGSWGRTLSRSGIVAVFGAEVTGGLTRSVGVVVSAHKNAGVVDLSQTNSEVFPVGEHLGGVARSGVVLAPQLDQWGVGVGLRFGRQR